MALGETLRHPGHLITRRRFFVATGAAVLAGLSRILPGSLGSIPDGQPMPKPQRAAAAGTTPELTIAATPTIVPSVTKEPTAIPNTATPPPTETPQPTSTVTATPTPKSGYGMENGLAVFRTEKGERLNVPQVSGLRVELKDINGQQKAVYLADKDNPYGLKENTTAGIFYPEAYRVIDSLETAQQVGSVGLRAEVIRYFLQQAGSPSKNVLFPLPFDPTFAPGDSRFSIQESRDKEENLGIFLKVPIGSKFVVPIESQNRSLPATFSPQQWGGTTFYIGLSEILGQYAFYAGYGGPLPSKRVQHSLGDPLFDITIPSFPNDILENAKKLRDPKPVIDPNFEIYGKQLYAAQDGSFPRLGLSEENVIKVDNSYVFIVANDNPLLNQ